MTFLEVRQKLVHLQAVTAAAFLPNLDEYFTLADKSFLFARLAATLPDTVQVKAGNGGGIEKARLLKVPSVTIPADGSSAVSAAARAQLEDLIAPELQSVIDTMQNKQGFVLKPRYGGYGHDVQVFARQTAYSDAFVCNKLNEYKQQHPTMDFLVEPFVEKLAHVEHRVYVVEGGKTTWMVDTCTSSPGVMVATLMQPFCVTDMVKSTGQNNIEWCVSKNGTTAALLIEAAKAVRDALLSGRHLAFSTACMFLRVDMCYVFLPSTGQHVIMVNEIDFFGTGFLVVHDPAYVAPELARAPAVFAPLLAHVREHIRRRLAEHKNLTVQHAVYKAKA